jgi:YHS domain-containing protein
MKHAFLFIACFLVTMLSIAQTPTSYFNKDGVAIKGYDVVAYFNDGKAVEGSKEFVYTWAGSDWRFKNQANLETFKQSPLQFAPQFGGFCAYGVSENHKSPTDPLAFTIVNDKLYLNYNAKVKETWSKDIKGNISKAETHWIVLKDQK